MRIALSPMVIRRSERRYVILYWDRSIGHGMETKFIANCFSVAQKAESEDEDEEDEESDAGSGSGSD